MRRVFPLRPAETCLLVTYDNRAFEHDDSDELEPPPSSAASALKHRRHSSTDFSVKKLPSAFRKLPPPASDYPEFANVASPSPPSSQWTSSFFDDGESTSFNSSHDPHRCPTSCVSSSSSSSINFNPDDSGSSSALSPSKDVDALLDTASSFHKASECHSNADNSECNELKVNLRVKTRTLEVDSPAAKPSLKALAFGNLPELVQPETPTYVIPKKVEEYMQNCLDMPSTVVQSRQSVSTPKAPDRTRKSSGSCAHLSRSVESPRHVPSKTPVERKVAENCSCSIPFKYLAKCLKSEKRRTASGEDDNRRQLNSSAKFSMLLNGLYSPQPSPRARLQLQKDSIRQTDCVREDLGDRSEKCDVTPMKAASLAASRSHTPGRIRLKVSDARSISGVSGKSPPKCQSFGSAMVNDYVRRVQDEAKSVNFRKSPRSASFHYESDSSLPKQSRPQSGIAGFANKSVNFHQQANAGISNASGRRLELSSTKVSRRRPFSMDLASRLGRDESTCLGKADNENLIFDSTGSSDLFAAEEKNLQTLALLRLEINKLCKEKRFLARELAAEMKARHFQQESSENVIRNMEVEMEEKLISVEKDHAYARACLEQEMDRRKKEWSAKLDKIRAEEKRLRDRVTEMALERVELQKAISFHKSKEASFQAQAKDHEMSVQTWMRRHRQSEEEVLLLRNSFTNVCNKLGDKEHELDHVLQRSKALERENGELFKETMRLKRAYADQDVTFEKLWQRLLDIVNGPSDSKVESLRRLHGELKVFAVREQALRYEIGVIQSQLLRTKQRASPACEEGPVVLSSSRMYSPEDDLRSLKNSTVKSLETVEELISKLELTKQHTERVEHQLEVKEDEVELLHSAIQEHENVIKDLQAELSSVKVQRDGLRKQVQQMSQEAIRLTRDLTELRQIVEKLDEELMLKEGEISILRDTCTDGDFLE